MGAAFNVLMEEETKESLAELCCKLMDEINSKSTGGGKVVSAEIAFATKYQEAVAAGWLERDGKIVAPTKQYEFLNENFLTLMNDIGRLGHEKFGADAFEATGNERRIKRHQKEEILRHARVHLFAYENGTRHTRLNTMRHQLAAAAFNCMLEYIFSQGE